MKKVGIITLNGNTNFGNRLQNYALQTVIKKNNCSVDTIWFCNYKIYFKEKLKKIVFYFINKRQYNFIYFSRKYIKTKYYFSNKISNKYDKFVVGSDQVWNYNYLSFNFDYLLSFSPKEKNIAYSASFGVDNIVTNYKNIFIKGLNNIKYISVREDRGKKIVEELTGRKDIEVLIDPTMLLTKNEWEKVSKKPKMLKNKKYILNYFLGELSSERKKEIEKIAKENNCEIINILDKESPFYICGPSEFLYLEKNAFLICTDSFHSSVFAILFNRPFVVFDREDKEESMNSRIDTLLNKFELNNRRYNGKITNELLKNDYNKVYNILEIERKKANTFLKNVLDIKAGE